RLLALDQLGRHLGARRMVPQGVRVEDLVLDDAVHGRALHAVLEGLAERVVEVGADGALGPGARERVAGAALRDEELLAGDDVVVLRDRLLAAARSDPDSPGAERQ